jgi:hypothetical protein
LALQDLSPCRPLDLVSEAVDGATGDAVPANTASDSTGTAPPADTSKDSVTSPDAGNNGATPHASPLQTPARGIAPAEPVYGLADLNLRAGDWLQIQLPPGAGSQRVRTRVIGHAPNHMLFVTAPSGQAAPMTLQPAERLELWTFSGEDIFHFVCTVERVERAPFAYVVMSAPALIRRKVLRRSQRAPARLVATVTDADAISRLGMLQDVSAEGVSLMTPAPLGSPGDVAQLAFIVRVGDIDVAVATEGTIRGVQPTDDGGHLHGIELPALDPSHYVALKCYVYERLLALGNG